MVAQGDLVGLGNVTGLDGPQPFTQSFACLAQELERVGSRALRSGAIRISPVLLDEVCLKCRSDFVGCLQRVVDGPVPCGVVNHVASIPQALMFAGRNWLRRPGVHLGECGRIVGMINPATATAEEASR